MPATRITIRTTPTRRPTSKSRRQDHLGGRGGPAGRHGEPLPPPPSPLRSGSCAHAWATTMQQGRELTGTHPAGAGAGAAPAPEGLGAGRGLRPLGGATRLPALRAELQQVADTLRHVEHALKGPEKAPEAVVREVGTRAARLELAALPSPVRLPVQVAIRAVERAIDLAMDLGLGTLAAAAEPRDSR